MVTRLVFLIVLTPSLVSGALPDMEVLFDGDSLGKWEFDKNGWHIAKDGSMTCRFEKVPRKGGKFRLRSLGYIWTRQSFGDFRLKLSYRLAPGANSGVFFRTDPSDPVQKGFEVQLLDDVGYLKTHEKLEAKRRNGALYDSQAARSHAVKPVGQWNHMELECKGPEIRIRLNGVVVNNVDISRWDTARQNPDGTVNKFKTALGSLPRTGRIGFQNHGAPVAFRRITIERL